MRRLGGLFYLIVSIKGIIWQFYLIVSFDRVISLFWVNTRAEKECAVSKNSNFGCFQ